MRGKLIVWVMSAAAVGACGEARTRHRDTDAESSVDAQSSAIDPRSDTASGELRDVSNTPDRNDFDTGVVCTCGGPVRCPGGHHVDCFRSVRCDRATRSVFINPHAPYHACDDDAAAALLAADICGQYGRMNGYVTCQAGCDEALRDARYERCIPAGRPFAAYEWLMRYKCIGVRDVGAACSTNDDCHPVVDTADLNLACVAGRCERIARPSPPGFGEGCQINESMLRAGVTAVGAELCVVSGAPGCWRQRRTTSCVVDEQCPAGWDCSIGDSCDGTCLPREANRSPANLATPCAAPDASTSDASADAGDAR